jgi:hypothetical protein
MLRPKKKNAAMATSATPPTAARIPGSLMMGSMKYLGLFAGALHDAAKAGGRRLRLGAMPT